MRKIAALMLIIGVLLLAKGLWIPIKAEISQILLFRAWEEAREGKDHPKPWPWADVTAVGKLSVETQNIELIILSGMSGQSLAFGPGHNEETSIPGQSGFVMLSGHRDTHFNFLQDVTTGDVISLEGRYNSRDYKVSESFIIDTRTETLHSEERDMLVLVTCYPFDGTIPSTPFRYVVVAEKK